MNWDRAYEEGDTPWDRGGPAPELARVIAAGTLSDLGRKVAVPGCGTGHDARALAEAGFEVTGLDLSPLALEKARALDPNDKVTWEKADVLDFANSHPARFDWVWEHTCLSGLPPALREGYFNSLAASLSANGELVGIFFIDTEVPLDEGPPFSISENELESLIAPHFAIVKKWPALAVYEGRGGIEICYRFAKK